MEARIWANTCSLAERDDFPRNRAYDCSMTAIEELMKVANLLAAAADTGADAEHVSNPLNALGEAADKTGRSFSGSWLGYHARVYYEDFQTPPPGARFDQEWGLGDHLLRESARAVSGRSSTRKTLSLRSPPLPALLTLGLLAQPLAAQPKFSTPLGTRRSPFSK
jgi:hypothetical protein